ncbi:MAG: DUF3467 domain-containing protein [Planctomycetaceae bacterium]|nr:DUF3467 domain-containing protein [Planctomycetaceae bacterium]
MADAKKTPQAPAIPADPAAGQQQTVRIELDDSEVSGLYANLCRVSSTPEEVILDLALNPNPLHQGTQNLKVSQRVILNHFTAKRLAALLTATVQRHEQAFGRLETDIRKRLQPEAGGEAQQS